MTATVNVSISTPRDTLFVLHIRPSKTSFGETTFASKTMGIMKMRRPSWNGTWTDGQTTCVCISRCRSTLKLATVQQRHQTEADDGTAWNDQEYHKLTRENAVPSKLGIEKTGLQIKEHCKSVCQNFQGWDLPHMYPWSPSKHGHVEDQGFVWSVFGLENEDGAGGHWPLEEPPNEPPHKIHRGGITATGPTGEGTIDYYQCDQKIGESVSDRIQEC